MHMLFHYVGQKRYTICHLQGLFSRTEVSHSLSRLRSMELSHSPILLFVYLSQTVDIRICIVNYIVFIKTPQLLSMKEKFNAYLM